MEEKKQKKIEKLNKDIERSKNDLIKSRETVKDSMKQSYEDIELWKQKELAKGKDPEKVEKKYQRGLKIIERIDSRMDRFHDRMETKVEDWDYNGRLKLEKSAHKKMMKKVFTSSLSKMEKILEEDPTTELRYPIAGYCAIVKKENINPVTHPRIYKEVQNWENAIKKASKNEQYFKTFLSFLEEGDKKQKKLNFKIEVVNTINEIMEKENYSIRFLSEYSKIKYSNLYNFLKKEIYTDVSFKKAHKLLWLTLNVKNGYTREEAFLKYSQTVKDNWEDEDYLKIENKIEE